MAKAKQIAVVMLLGEFPTQAFFLSQNGYGTKINIMATI